MAKRKQKAKVSFKNNRTVWAIGALLVIVVGYFGIYQPISINQDKQRFLTAEKEIEALSDQIQAKIGKADQVAKDNSCDRANLKSSEGPLLCSTGFDLLYENKDFEQANSLMSQVASFFGRSNPLKGSGGTSGIAFVKADARKITQTFYQEYSLVEELSCGFGYSYRIKVNESEILTAISEDNFKIDISCGGPAKAEYFKLR